MTTEELVALAEQAYLYGYPTVDCYAIMHRQALDPTSPEFRAPFNRIGHARNVATPAERAIVAPNVDTPYSYAWLDLRAEPVVLTIPPFDAGRYVGLELFDLYTYIVGYVTPRTNGHAGGDFLVAGPDWVGEWPAGVKAVFHVPTRIAFGLYRTQLFDPADIANVHAIQDGYQIRTLSEYWNLPPRTPAAPFTDVRPIDVRKETESLQFFTILNALLQYMPALDDEIELRERFAQLGIVPGAPFAPADEETGAAVAQGMAAGLQRMYRRAPTVRSSAELFGSREYLGHDYEIRAVGALLGIFGNAAEEYLGVGYQRDADGEAFNGAHRYRIKFAADKLPPVDAFWSLTVYTADKFLYANPIDRYVINSPLVPALQKDADGGFTLYVQHEAPGAGQEANWLPVPAGDFGLTFRCYQPGPAIRDGSWQAPPVLKAR
ncbi:MAG: DUF1254 domain-containing protein [Anaerolineae bacterium]|jgi:hypothetical protein|nr:DUF1254 domain-containing protein [Anaerolineae bacterium]